MASLRSGLILLSIGTILIQILVLFLQINRWNEIIGAIFSIVVSISILLSSSWNSPSKDQWFNTCCNLILVADILFQLINIILLICLQWVVIQYCFYSNYTVDIALYGGIACYDWWQMGYGSLNHKDRALIVTICMGAVIVLRIIMIVFVSIRSRFRHIDPIFYTDTSLKDRNVTVPPRTSDIKYERTSRSGNIGQIRGSRTIQL